LLDKSALLLPKRARIYKIKYRTHIWEKSMKLLFQGKTKDVFDIDDNTYLLKLKDDATGKDGVFDPGGNSVGLSIEGLGRESLRLSTYYFEYLEKAGVPTHYISSDLEAVSMTVRPVEIFGKGVEVICRFKAAGSFLRRYGDYAEEGQDLSGFVEFTLKSDNREDPPITKDGLLQLRIMTDDEYESCKAMALRAAGLIREDMAKKGIELYDIKFEFGKANGKVILMDEISGGSLRAYKDGRRLDPMELTKLLL
jgi:phosphoribosylaminoimidazole-succinocarboxamide synthase